MTSEEFSDADLVLRSLAGDRDAFGRIVSRYQKLICSLAYSRTGNLQRSEDVAQETFITAWKHLPLLREPAKLRAWLCGIVRNRIYKDHRREGREPAHNARPLDAAPDAAAAEPPPVEHAVRREEAAMLWRALERIPEIHREPLILFYREHHSIEAVATALDLSQDAVKQRLSRGRELLQAQVQAFVESTLERTAPGPDFCGAILAALPAAPASTLTISAAGTSTAAAAAKSGFLATCLAPILGILGGIWAHRLIVRAAPTARERRLKKSAFIALWIFVLAWCIPAQLAMQAWRRNRGWSDLAFFRIMAGFWWFYAMVLATLSIALFRRILAIREQTDDPIAAPHPNVKPPRAVLSRIAPIAGVHLAWFSWLIGLAIQARDPIWAGILTALMAALAGRNLLTMRGKTGPAAARAIGRHQMLLWAIVLAILNLRLPAWLASMHNVSLPEFHRLLPASAFPVLTFALIIWAGLLITLSEGIRRGQDMDDPEPTIKV